MDWWAYLHSNGSIQIKRWFGDVNDYTTDCYGNDFVVEVIKPFKADTRELALEIVYEQLAKRGYQTC